jgi:hypothetical protein
MTSAENFEMPVSVSGRVYLKPNVSVVHKIQSVGKKSVSLCAVGRGQKIALFFRTSQGVLFPKNLRNV